MNREPSSIDLAWRDVVRCVVAEALRSAHVRAYVCDVAAAWERMHPGQPLPEDPHVGLAAIYANAIEGPRIHARSTRRQALLGRIYQRRMAQIGG